MNIFIVPNIHKDDFFLHYIYIKNIFWASHICIFLQNIILYTHLNQLYLSKKNVSRFPQQFDNNTKYLRNQHDYILKYIQMKIVILNSNNITL